MNAPQPDTDDRVERKPTSTHGAAAAIGANRMPKVGDTVTVTIGGAPGAGTSLGGAIRIGPGASMQTPGKIVEDHGDYWLVELTISIGDKNRVLIPKSSQRRT